MSTATRHCFLHVCCDREADPLRLHPIPQARIVQKVHQELLPGLLQPEVQHEATAVNSADHPEKRYGYRIGEKWSTYGTAFNSIEDAEETRAASDAKAFLANVGFHLELPTISKSRDTSSSPKEF